MNDDEKLKALTNEPVKIVLGGEELTLKRPTIRDYKKIRSYLKEIKVADAANLGEDNAIDFSVFFISTLLIEPQYSPEDLEDKIFITDLSKLSELMEQLGFTKPQKKTEQVSPEAPKETLTGAGFTQP